MRSSRTSPRGRRTIAAAALAFLGLAPAALGQVALPSATPLDAETLTEGAALAREAAQQAGSLAALVGRGEDAATVAAAGAAAIDAAERALALEPQLAEAWNAIALVHRQFWRWSAARRAYEQAYAIAPNDRAVLFAFGWFNAFSGRHAQAIAMGERGVALAPDDASAHRDLGIAYAYAGDAENGAAALRRCTALDPEIAVCHIWLGFMLGLLGEPDEAARELALAEALAGEAMNAATTSSIAHAYSRIGRAADAARLFARLERLGREGVVGAGSWPLGHLAVGDVEQAYAALERAVAKIEEREPDEGFFNLMIIKGNVLQNPVLDEPRFVALRERIGAF